jgi:heme-degrading monooxygenase HmoA
MSRFRVQPGQEDRVHEAFRQRPHRVDDQPGFVRMEVMRPEERPNEFWLITVWRDRASFERWHRHHMADSHQAMPPGLTLEPGSQALEYLELVSE